MNAEFFSWVKLASYSFIEYFLLYFPWLLSLSFVGKINLDDLAALSLYEVWIYSILGIIWNAIIITQLQLTSKAFGMKSMLWTRLWGLISVILVTCLNCIVAIICIKSKNIILLFGVNDYLATIGQPFSSYIIPFVLMSGLSLCSSTYLECINKISIVLYIKIFSRLIEIPFTYYLLFHTKINCLKSVAIGRFVGSFISAVLNIFTIIFTNQTEFDKNYGKNEFELLFDLKYWNIYLLELIPNITQQIIIVVSWVTNSIYAAKMNNHTLTSNNLCLTLFELLLTITYGLTFATGVRISYHIGNNDLKNLYYIIKLSIISSIVISVIISIICYYNKYEIILFLTKDIQITNEINSIIILIWINFIIFSIGLQLSACLLGIERTKAIFLGNICVGLTLTIIFYNYTHLKLYGIWLASMIGYICFDILIVYKVYQINWELLLTHISDENRSQIEKNEVSEYSSLLSVS